MQHFALKSMMREETIMAEMKVTIEEIKQLMEKMVQTGLGQLVLEDADFKLKLSAQKEQSVVFTAPEVSLETSKQAVANGAEGTDYLPAYVPAHTQTHAEPELAAGNVVECPIIGTFYAAPSPDKAPFVKVGDWVKKGDVIFIIESMKLMNEIQSEFDGEVAEILVENGSPVEYGQPAMIIR